MTTITVDHGPGARPAARRFLRLQCACGRGLRAPLDRVGGTVTCWDCRRAVPVPSPRPLARSARVMSHGVRSAFGPRVLAGVALGSFAFAAALWLPVPEPVVAGLLLAGLVFAYAEAVRRVGLAGPLGLGLRSGGEPESAAARVRGMAARGALTLAVALVLTNAWEFARAWLGYEPGLLRATAGGAAALSVLFPLVMLTLWAVPRPRLALQAIGRHPVYTAVALLVVPLGLVAAEAAVVAVTSAQGYFAYYVLDLYPSSGAIAHRFGIDMLANYEAHGWADPRFFALYAEQLRNVGPLSVALPASVADPSSAFLRPWAVEGTVLGYALVRSAHCVLLAAVWLTALTVQAHCIGLLGRLWDWQRPRTEPSPSPSPLPTPTPTDADPAASDAPAGPAYAGPRAFRDAAPAAFSSW